jgi:hypothetical protein
MCSLPKFNFELHKGCFVSGPNLHMDIFATGIRTFRFLIYM